MFILFTPTLTLLCFTWCLQSNCLHPSQVCSSISIRWVVSLCLSCLRFVPPPNRMHIMLKESALTSSKYNQCHNKEGKEPWASEELLQDLRNPVNFLFPLFLLLNTVQGNRFILPLFDSWQWGGVRGVWHEAEVPGQNRTADPAVLWYSP